MNINQVRGILSTILIISGLISFTTGAILYFVKYGMWLCFTRKLINDTHAVSALVMGIAIIVHLAINRHMYRMEMKAFFPKKPLAGEKKDGHYEK